jgi:hypothetical protein
MMLGTIGFTGWISAGPCAVGAGALLVAVFAIAAVVLVVADVRSAS